MHSAALFRRFFLLAVVLLLTHAAPVHAQEVHAAPGQFDYYLLNLSWAPEFCHNVEVLPETERFQARRDQAATECSTPHGFVLHGLWPQNTNGTWPANCSNRPGPASYAPWLGITPDLTLLQHEWTKHGTCTTLAPDAFFNTAKRAFQAVQIPQQLQSVDHALQLTPDDILASFYRANPAYPQGSIVISCGRNYLTAINVCLSKDGLQPMACQNVHACGAKSVKVAPETTSTAARDGAKL